MRRPFLVGLIPFEITRPMMGPSIPVSSDAIGEMVLASRSDAGCEREDRAQVGFPGAGRSARAGPTPFR